MRKVEERIYTNKLFRKVTYIYSTILIFMGILALYMAYSKGYTELVGQMELTMSDLKHDYESSTENFWRLYMPIFEDRTGTYEALRKYFISDDKDNLSPIDKKNLVDALQTIMEYDNSISWIGVFSNEAEYSYVLFKENTTLTVMTEDFPYLEDLKNKTPGKEVYGSKLVRNAEKEFRSFALCGGTALDMQDGKIIIGYNTNKIGSAYMKMEAMEDVRFCITNEFGIIYDSFDKYDEECTRIAACSSDRYIQDGELMYIHRLQGTGKNYSVFGIVAWADIVLKSNSMTLFIIVIVMLFSVLSLLIYRWTGRIIVRKMDAIQQGLYRIGENDLDYRIEIPDVPTDEFENIAQLINKMTERLQENVEKTYELRLKQKEAVLSELQAKFDPHFLYNTLEVIRGRVYENGDIETSDIIIKLAQIFRSFIGSERFVSIRDEMDFCNMYLSLLKYRYEDRITIIYDIESEIMEYGIIRNLLQPILENFFVHGFKPESQHNMLKIRGKVYDEKYIWFYIWDNGLGIPEEKLIELKESFREVESSAKSSYGLKNVQRRIKLFYGRDCGLEIKSNEAGGTTVEVKIRRLTCIGHEMRMYDIEALD